MLAYRSVCTPTYAFVTVYTRAYRCEYMRTVVYKWVKCVCVRTNVNACVLLCTREYLR